MSKKYVYCVLLLAICAGCIPIKEHLDLKRRYANDPFFDLSPNERRQFVVNRDIETKFYYHVAVMEYYRPNFIYDFSVELAAEDNYIPFAIAKLNSLPREMEIYALFTPLKELDFKRKKALSHDDEAMKVLHDSLELLSYSLFEKWCAGIYQEILAIK